MMEKCTRFARLLAPAALAALYGLSIHAYYPGFFNDDAFYVIGARSLAQGRYAELSAPGEPPLVNYTPGYPLLLAPLMRLNSPLWVCQLLSVAMILAALWLLKRCLARETDARAASAAWLLMALNPLTVSLSGTLLSEPAYLLTSVAALALARERWRESSPGFWAALGCLIGFTCAVRPAGAALALALAAALAKERRLKPAALCLAAPASAVLIFLARNRIVAGNALPYLSEFASAYRSETLAALSANCARNLSYYLYELFSRTMFRFPAPRAAALALEAAGSGVLLAGLLQESGGFEDFVRLYLLAYAAVHLAWAKQSGRYLFGVLPWLLVYFFRGTSALERRWPRLPWTRSALALSLLFCLQPLLGILRASLFLTRTPVNTPPEHTFAWIRARTDPSDVFAAELDARLYLHTGRRAVHLPKPLGPAHFSLWLKARGVRYVLVFPNDFILRTSGGEGPHDPLPVPRLQALLKDIGGREAFKDAQEGSAVYRVP